MEKAVILPEKKNNYRHKTPAHQQFANSFFFFFFVSSSSSSFLVCQNATC